MAGTYAIAGIQGSGPMAKAMSVAGMVIGGLVALLFALDLALEIPFGGEAGVHARYRPGPLRRRSSPISAGTRFAK